MRAAVIPGAGSVQVVEQEAPRAKGDIVVVQILVAPLCTEFKDRRVGNVGEHLGHEAAGVVVDAGTSTLVAVGDRVVVMPQFACGRCWLCLRGEHIYCPNQRDVLAETGSEHGTGTLAQYVLKPDWLLLPVPDDIPLDHAVMACCGFGPSFNAHQRMGTNALDTLLVSGCGPVGLGAIVQGGVLGAEVLAIETHPYRAELALKLGAREVFDPRSGDVPEGARAWGGGLGPSTGIETSGAPTAASLLATSIRARGRLSVVAWTNELVLPAIVPAGLDIFGCWHWNHQRFLPEMWTMIRRAGAAIDTMITHRMPLDDIAAAMDVQDSGECGKILLLPFGEESL